ncbi:hypothetical protein PENSPDRAFT_658791 [Peniophora sp. CONT]|nr:hypothetical protein PENSPDRAFT_658791 [Peniophora sp. CONT]
MIEMEHANGILLHLFKLGEVRRRTLAVAVRYNSMDATASEAFRDSVASCYREGDRRPMMPLFENAIAFRAAPDHLSGPGRFSHTYPSNSGKQWYILDVEAADLSRIVPLNVSVPYVGRGPGRAALLLDAIDPVPLWVVTNEGLGVPVTREGNEELYHAHRQVTTADGRARRTVSVKIEWPGYPLWEAQIRMKADESRVADSCTFMRLVRHVKGKVRKFISDHADVPCSDPHWAVGDVAQGRITANDLTLLAIVAVSQGAVMPILKLRDDFDFTTSNTVATDNYQDGYTPAAAGPMSVPKEQLDLDDNLVSDTEQLYHPDSLSDAGLSFYAGHWQYQGPFDDYRPYN